MATHVLGVCHVELISHCDDNQEGTVFSLLYIYIYIYTQRKREREEEVTKVDDNENSVFKHDWFLTSFQVLNLK